MNFFYSDFLAGEPRPFGIYAGSNGTASPVYVENAARDMSAGAAGGSFWWDNNHNIGVIAFAGEPASTTAPPPGHLPYPLGYAGGESWIDSFRIA